MQCLTQIALSTFFTVRPLIPALFFRNSNSFFDLNFNTYFPSTQNLSTIVNLILISPARAAACPLPRSGDTLNQSDRRIFNHVT